MQLGEGGWNARKLTPFAYDGRSLPASHSSQTARRMGHCRLGRLSENPQPSESRRERVSQRDAESCGPGRTELVIIIDQVKIGFRADEEVSPEVVAQAGAEVTHKVIAADKVGTADRTTTGEALVEAQAFPSDARRKLGSRALSQLGGVYSIEIIEEWTIRLETGIEILTGSPGKLATHAKPML